MRQCCFFYQITSYVHLYHRNTRITFEQKPVIKGTISEELSENVTAIGFNRHNIHIVVLSALHRICVLFKCFILQDSKMNWTEFL